MRGYNFGAGPAQLPEAILIEAANELLDWNNSGMSIMEIGHRSDAFMELLAATELQFRTLLSIPHDYEVIFLGGAARTQFSMVPLNLLEKNNQAAYIISGIWSQLAFAEAQKLSDAYVLARIENGEDFISMQDIKPATAYAYYTPNETINGIRIAPAPKLGVPLVADMTSFLFSEPCAIQDYGLIFAGSQKNIAPAGLTVVIVRRELLERNPATIVPTMIDYRTHVAANSLYATPPTFNIYMANKMCQWLQNAGGVNAVYQSNLAKSQRLYEYIDNSSLYHCPIVSKYRSLMNICFNLRDTTLESSFLIEATAAQLYALKGHKLVGGCRASLYNSMPMAGVDALITFMQLFEQKH